MYPFPGIVILCWIPGGDSSGNTVEFIRVLFPFFVDYYYIFPVCLSVICNVRGFVHPTQPVEISCNVSTPSVDIHGEFYGDHPRKTPPSGRGVIAKITRNSSGDEIANVNFLYDDIVHVLQDTTDLCINSATDRRSYVLERMFTEFSEITQYNGHYAVQGHSRSPILVPLESSYTTSY